MYHMTPIEYLSNDREDLPSWLKEYASGKEINMKDILSSRILYNPGAGLEGAPIRVFNKAHAVHMYVYVDYGFTRDVIDEMLSEGAFLGYHLIGEEDISESELAPHSFSYHLTRDELSEIEQEYRNANVPTQNSFCMLKIYERDADFGEDHGAERFAVLYIGGDAIATYDVLFGNTDRYPYVCVIQNYGFDGSYSPFCAGSYLERIAVRSHRMPKYLLCGAYCNCWDGYEKQKNVDGSYGRFLWRKNGKNNA